MCVFGSAPFIIRLFNHLFFFSFRLLTSLPAATLPSSALRAAVSTSTTCSPACTAVAMAMMGKVSETFVFLRLQKVAKKLNRSAAADVPAHGGAVRGVAVDGLNQLTFTAGSDWLLKIWCFKAKTREGQLELSAAPAHMRLHRER